MNIIEDGYGMLNKIDNLLVGLERVLRGEESICIYCDGCDMEDGRKCLCIDFVLRRNI